jgi:UDP-N-acetylglucosamine transferase subunit ALG13
VIFVTVGTHEQPFDRLLRAVDGLAEAGALPCGVFCQTGYSSYEPRVPFARMLPYEETQRRMGEALAVVTHGGPGSVLPVLAAGKPLVLVPRQQRFGEHVDDHQVAFCGRVARESGAPMVDDIGTLGEAIRRALGHRNGVAPRRVAEPSGIATLARHIAFLSG